MELLIEKMAFPLTQSDRGFQIQAFYLQNNPGDALVEIWRDNEPYRRFLYPAYKIWNLVAHFSDIVTGEINGNYSGYDLAGWTGFNVIPIREL